MVKKKGGQPKRPKNNKVDNKTPKQNLEQHSSVINEEEDDDIVDDEDLEFYENIDRSLDFLTNLDTGETTEEGGRRKKRKLAQEETEADYEKQPRAMTQDDTENKHELLPIKSKKGLIQRIENKPVDQDDNNNEKVESHDTEDTENKESEPVIPASLSIVELYAKRQQKLNERRMRIAELSNEILENPEENISQLKELCAYCEESDVDVQITVRKLAILSMLEIFKDIVPGYSIRAVTEKEKETKVSKDVKKLRDFEEGLLTTYQNYLQILEKSAQGRSKADRKRKANGNIQKHPGEGLVLISIQCLCDLLVSLSHFNYRNNIITVLVPKMNDVRSLDGQVSQLSCEAFKTLFKQDKVGEVSLEATKVISKYVKGQSYKVQPCVLQVFLHLRINDMDVLSLRDKKDNDTKQPKLKGQNKRDKILKAKMSKKERKRQKELKVLEKELQATHAVEGQERRAKLQTEVLKFVFATYFRVLKYRASSLVLSPVLEGLAKYAHLINVDFFSDLMAALSGLINKEDLPLRDKLNCALTAFKILSGQGEALNIDPRGFYCTLYNSLLQLNADFSNSDVDIALKCLDVMMKKRTKQIPIQRVSAFTKRLSTVSLQVMPNSALALLQFVKVFFQLHPKCQKLLDSETMGIGVFRPEVEDPELSNTDSTTSWELSYLTSHHYHPTVKALSGYVVNGDARETGSSLTRMQPEELFKTYDCTEMNLNPDISDLEKTNIKSNKKFKSYFHLTEDDFKDSSIESAINDAVSFTDKSLKDTSFVL